MPASMGHATKVGIGDAAPTTKQLIFKSCSVRKIATHIDDAEHIRSGRSHFSGATVDGTYAVSGSLVMDPRYDELASILKYINGGTPASTDYPLAETLPTFFFDEATVGDDFRFTGCKVNQATFRSSKNRPLELTLDIEGLTCDDTITFPSIAASLSAVQPFVHHNLVCTLNSVEYKVDNVEVVVNNGLITDRYFNSQTRTELPEGDRIVTFAADFPFTSVEKAAFWDLAVAGITGRLKWTLGTTSLQFDFISLAKATEGPVINARGQEVGWRLGFTARETAAVKELVTTLDSTP